MFEKFTGADGPRWRLKGANGEIQAESEGYSTPEHRDEGIASVIRAVLEGVDAELAQSVIPGAAKFTISYAAGDQVFVGLPATAPPAEDAAPSE